MKRIRISFFEGSHMFKQMFDIFYDQIDLEQIKKFVRTELNTVNLLRSGNYWSMFEIWNEVEYEETKELFLQRIKI
jgi:hypothetical protein